MFAKFGNTREIISIRFPYQLRTIKCLDQNQGNQGKVTRNREKSFEQGAAIDINVVILNNKIIIGITREIITFHISDMQ